MSNNNTMLLLIENIKEKDQEKVKALVSQLGGIVKRIDATEEDEDKALLRAIENSYNDELATPAEVSNFLSTLGR